MLMIFGQGTSRSGSGGGVGDYYLYGTNNDRNTKDNRVVLSGNLNTLVKTIDIAHQIGYKETYRNIVLSFNEDYIREKTLGFIAEDFRKQYLAGYKEDEYVFYAEAHLPKIKTKKDKDTDTGKIIYRKPHIHITVAAYSPRLEKALSLGNHGQRLNELKTWKEITEKRYGLQAVQNSALQKDITEIYDTKLHSRKEVIELCNKVILNNLEDKILDPHRLKMTLKDNIAEIEYIKESTSKAKIPYYSIKMKNLDRPIRLKGKLFANDYLTFQEAKEQLLEDKFDNKYYEVGLPRKVPSLLENKLNSYYESRCRCTTKREANARAKLNTEQSELVDVKAISDLPIINNNKKKLLTSEVQTTIKFIKENIDIKNANSIYKDYKATLHPKYLFAILNTNMEKYRVLVIKNEYRVRCGKRHLNIHDFLTKEMNLSWFEAKVVMDKAALLIKEKNTAQPKKVSITNNTFTYYQEKILYKVYHTKIEHTLKSYYIKVDDDNTVHISSKEKDVAITDYGNKLIANGQNIKEEVKLMLDIAIAKDWNLSTIKVTGSEEFEKEAQKQIQERLEIEDNRFNNELDALSQNLKELNERFGHKANPKKTNDDIKNKPFDNQDAIESKTTNNRKKYR